MSWGIKITVLYLGFVAIILTLVIICFGHKTELEYTDYYTKELKFQGQIDATNNANKLKMPIDYIIHNRSVQLIFPKEIISDDLRGTIHFMRPCDASLDKMIKINPGSDAMQTIDPGFLKGVYKMQISIESQNKNYFKEAILTFQ